MLFQTGEIVNSTVTFITDDLVQCEAPKSERFNVTLSNYGDDLQSDPLTYMTYDSFCKFCDADTLLCDDRVSFWHQF